MNCRYLSMGVSASALLLGAQTALAQSAPQPVNPPAAQAKPEPSNPEIIVTANKREQSANSVGLTIQAASGTELVQRGISSPSDLAKLVPGFTYTQSIYSTPVYTLRGIGLYDATFGAPPSVSVYSDQIPRNVPVMSDALDLDIERVEVLKGPQGTLFGQSSTGGAINYIVGKPTKDFHAGFNASYERFDRAELSGFISGPISDSVQARLAAKGITGGAWQFSQSRPGDTNGATRKVEGRLIVDIEPATDLKIELMATGSRDRSDPQAPQYIGSYLNYYPTAAAAAASGNPYAVVNAQRYADLTTPGAPAYNSYFATVFQPSVVSRMSSTNPAIAAGARAVLGTPVVSDPRAAEWTPGLLTPSDNSYYQFSGRVDYNLSPIITVTSVTALARSGLNYNQSLDGTTALDANVTLFGSVRTFNQELRLAGNTDTVHWIVGGSYDHMDTTQNNYFYLNDYSGSAYEYGALLGKGQEYYHITTTLNQFSSTMRTYAAFANLEYKLDRLTLQGGLRYTNNRQAATYCYSDPAIDTNQGVAHYYSELLGSGPVGVGQCFPINPATGQSTLTPVVSAPLQEHNVSFRVGANYKFNSGTLLYATVSQGYKAGTFSAIGASRITQYTPAVQEKVIAYEAGFKTPLFGHAVQLNAASFYYDYTNKQVRGRITDPVFGVLEKMLNVPKSYIYGFEGELTVRPVEGLRLSASATYLDSKVTSNYSTTPDGLAVYNAEGYTGNFKGSQLPYTPHFSANIDGQYDFPVGNALKGFVGSTLVYQGSQNATFSTPTLLGGDFVIPHYATLDARVGVGTEDGRWQFQLYGRNITNTTYTTGISSYLDTTVRYRGKPITYGASLSFKY